MLYPLSYRRSGPVRNVVENPARVALEVPAALAKVPCVVRRPRSGRSDADSAYRDLARACVSSPATWGLPGSGVQVRSQAASEHGRVRRWASPEAIALYGLGEPAHERGSPLDGVGADDGDAERQRDTNHAHGAGRTRHRARLRANAASTVLPIARDAQVDAASRTGPPILAGRSRSIVGPGRTVPPRLARRGAPNCTHALRSISVCAFDS